MGTQPHTLKGAEPSIFGPFLLWPNGWMHQDATWYKGRPHLRGLCATWGRSSPPQKGAELLKSLARFYCGQMAGCIKMPLGMEVGFSPGDFVLDGDQARSRKGDGAPQCSAHVCCGQMAGWIKMALGMKVGLGPGDIVLDGDPASPPQKVGGAPPNFRPCLL